MDVKKRTKTFGNWYFPEEIIFQILVLLPANILYDVMRHVCRTWCNIIHNPDFIASHFERSTCGLLIHDKSSGFTRYVARMGKFKVDVQDMNFVLPGPILASYNGLVVFVNPKIPCLEVANPITKKHMKIPRLPGRAGEYCLGYVDSSRIYKLVRIKQGKFISIFTLGVDWAWRGLDISGHFQPYLNCFFPKSSPLSLGGFIYWAVEIVPYVVCLDVETERIMGIHLPSGFENQYSLKLLAKGGFLSVMVSKAINTWEVWVLIDPRTGNWEKLPDINVQGGLETPNPVGWLQSGEILVFHNFSMSDMLLLYNVKTGTSHSCFDMDFSRFGFETRYDAYVNSLLPVPERM